MTPEERERFERLESNFATLFELFNKHRHLGPPVDQTQKLDTETEPGGSDTQLQYNNAGVFGGIAEMFWNAVTGVLTLGLTNSEFNMKTADGAASGEDGCDFQLVGGAGNAAGANAHGATLAFIGGAGGATGGDGGDVNHTGGDAVAGNHHGGDVTETPGVNSGTGRKGRYIVTGPGGAPRLLQLLETTTTSDATPTTIDLFTTSSNASFVVQVRVVARRTSGSAGTAGDSAGYFMRALYKNIAGVTSLVGAIEAPFTAEDQAAWDATLVISSNTIQVQVTGAANNNITWNVEVSVLSSSSTIV